MASSSSPFTSKPLHNLDLPKWKTSDPKPTTTNHRRRSLKSHDSMLLNNKSNKPSSKILLKLPCKPAVKVETNDDEDDEAKTWNLRPRRPFKIHVNAQNTHASDNNKPPLRENELGDKEKQRVTLDVSLTKDEIDEDIFAFTGAKASRRPKKRHRNIQKRLDYCFPGLRLVSITPDSYKVPESSTKG